MFHPFLLISLFPIVFTLPISVKQGETIEQLFSRVDLDLNSRLTFEEFLRVESEYERLKHEQYERIDVNRDGEVSKDEFTHYWIHQDMRSDDERAQYYGLLFQEFDEDFDIHLNAEEVSRLLQQRFHVQVRSDFPKKFQLFDIDHDGSLDLFEFMKFDASFPYTDSTPLTKEEIEREEEKKKGEKGEEEEDEEEKEEENNEREESREKEEEEDGESEEEKTDREESVLKGKKFEKLPMLKPLLFASRTLSHSRPVRVSQSASVPSSDIHPLIPGDTRPMISIL